MFRQNKKNQEVRDGHSVALSSLLPNRTVVLKDAPDFMVVLDRILSHTVS